jgi:hypothetical protein
MTIILHKGIEPRCVVAVDPEQAGSLLKLLTQPVDERDRMARVFAAFMMEQEIKVFHRKEAIDAFPAISTTYTSPEGVIVRLPELFPYRVARTFMFAISLAKQLNTEEPLRRLESDLRSFIIGTKADGSQSCPFFLTPTAETKTLVI